MIRLPQVSLMVTFIIIFFPFMAIATFPDSFKWCSATASHQVEGNNFHSDWWAFESIPGNIKNNERSGIASNQWNLLETDILKMKSLGLNSYRFSIEWAKIEPKPGQWDESALLHYKKQVKLLKKAGIEPIVTLHHFTLPQWVALQGGWASPATITSFLRFSLRVFQELNEDVTYWVTFNEPTVQITAGYLDGVFPPKLKDQHDLALQALKNILTAHGEVVTQLRSIDKNKKTKFGFAHHLRVFQPAHPLNPLDYLMSFYLDTIWNWSFVDALKTGRFALRIPLQASIDIEIPNLIGSQDFFGINYYSRDLVAFSFSPPYFKRLTPAAVPKSDLQWEIYPEGLGLLLTEIHQKYPGIPILITENGIADAKDQWRGSFIKDHLQIVEKALNQGIPVIGYCHWSLIDNFEWAEGFTPRFGLYEVDYSTQERKLRQSALILREIIYNKSTEIKRETSK